MLDIIRVLKSAKSHERGELLPLSTPWGDSIDPAYVLPEHPRPTLQREAYAMLNGRWDYAVAPLPQGCSGPLPAPKARKAVSEAPLPSTWDGKILVPFSPEAPLSGVGRHLSPDELLWYRRDAKMPACARHERVLLHFEAVDWICAVYVNGSLAAVHQGGYLPFDVDITPHVARVDTDDATSRDGDASDTASPLQAGGSFEIALCVYDPSDAGTQPRGKQRRRPGGIWYTAQSGIWQSVWLEVVPALYIAGLTLQGTARGELEVRVTAIDARGVRTDSAETLRPSRCDGTSPAGATLQVCLRDSDGAIVTRSSLALAPSEKCARRLLAHATLNVDGPRLWSPDEPYLYDAFVTLDANAPEVPRDRVRSYCAFRTVEVKRDGAGCPRLHLNGTPLLVRGVLDQGYWPDGLMTAPSDAALVHDIQEMRSAGFNMLRKHIKIERQRWYFHCDRLGMLVWQDAVSGGGAYSPWHTSRKPTLFQASWSRFRDDTPSHRAALSAADAEYRHEWTRSCEDMVRLLAGHPSIVTWVLFNEGWGQFDAAAACRAVRALDPTRPVDATSGWYDQRCGDFLSHHNYFRPLGARRDPAGRAFVLSEFGGLTQLVAEHSASPTGYGYGDYPSIDAWRQAVLREIGRAQELSAQGLAGYVYTQLSDVEDELNGILTYDRRVNKLKE